MENLPESVDREILGGRIIHAIKAFRDASGCTLHEAIDVVDERAAELRRDRPDDFRRNREEDGRNVT
ncbi:hypothetical protein [Kitasatospora sp. CB01950]|uniref:hypothetical protein n=1 Tax=Kitasatospora sp. CB01950 TaxID=1703930 RepID=UPI00093D9C53|nr:hypothetical protein [Kitasatospora sp. CB01950]OKI99901.1 hypothetical protein AMK19_30745 [Kitasatospora sp. CB01950]